MNFADLNSCSSGRVRPYTTDEFDEDGDDPCAPQILLPTRMNRALSEWSSCTDNDTKYGYEVWDPPRALQPVAAMAPSQKDVITTVSPFHLSLTPSAEAGSSLQPPGAKATYSAHPEERSNLTSYGHSQIKEISSEGTLDEITKTDYADAPVRPTKNGSPRPSIGEVHLDQAASLQDLAVTAILITTHYLNFDPSNSIVRDPNDILEAAPNHEVNQPSEASRDGPRSLSSYSDLDNNSPSSPLQSFVSPSVTSLNFPSKDVSSPTATPWNSALSSSLTIGGFAALIMAGFENGRLSSQDSLDGHSKTPANNSAASPTQALSNSSAPVPSDIFPFGNGADRTVRITPRGACAFFPLLALALA